MNKIISLFQNLFMSVTRELFQTIAIGIVSQDKTHIQINFLFLLSDIAI